MSIVDKVKEIKLRLINDGFIIDAIFGSVARGVKNYNDIDLLYHLDNKFLSNYKGFIAFKRLEEIKELLTKELGVKVDLAPKNNLSNTAKKYMLKDIIYV